MVSVAIQFDPPLSEVIARVRQLAGGPEFYAVIDRATIDISDIVLAAVVNEAPSATNQFASQIRAERNATGITVLAPNPLLDWILYGTAPHSIDAAPGGYLRFVGADGSLQFRKHVDHPGTAANDFMSRAWANVAGEVVARWNEAGRELAAMVLG